MCRRAPSPLAWRLSRRYVPHAALRFMAAMSFFRAYGAVTLYTPVEASLYGLWCGCACMVESRCAASWRKVFAAGGRWRYSGGAVI